MSLDLSNNETQTTRLLRELFFSRAFPSWCGAATCVAVISLLLYGSVPVQQLILWAGVTGTVLALRLPAVVAAYRGRGSSNNLPWYLATQGSFGLMLGLLAFFSAPSLPLVEQVLVLLVPLVVLVSATLSLSSWPTAFHVFAWPLMIPYIVMLGFHVDGIFRMLLPVALCSFGFCISFAQQFHRQTRESLTLKIRNEQLVSDLSSQNAQLIKAREEAEAAVVAKDAFLARMSHELRTPMNGVMGIAQLLGESSLKEKQRLWVSSLKTSGNRLHELINDLLDATSLASNDISLSEECTPVSVIARALEDAYTQVFNEKGLTLVIAIDEQVPELVQVDRLRLNQVLRKLVDNAVKFTQTGGVVIKVTTSNDSGPLTRNDGSSGYLSFCISDTGVGIDSAALETVSDLFTQADGSADRRYEGSGLGLSIAGSIVELMNGNMSITSVVGRGTHATVNIPLKSIDERRAIERDLDASDSLSEYELTQGFTQNPIEPAAEASHHAEQYAEPSGVPERKRCEATTVRRVLVAEDNPINQLVIESMLEDLDCDITLAEDGFEALESLETMRFDIIFMDCQMPLCDGYEATRQARQRDIKIPIIAVTANTMAGDRSKCLDAGMDDYMAKPFTREELESMLLRWASINDGDDERVASAA